MTNFVVLSPENRKQHEESDCKTWRQTVDNIQVCVCVYLKEVKGTFPKSWSMKLFYELPWDSLVKFQMEWQKVDLCSCE